MSGSVGTAVSLSILIPLLFVLVSEPVGFLSPEKSKSYIYAFWVLLALSITFSKPSRYALTGYSRKDVNSVIERMPDLYTCSLHLLPALQNCLQRAEEDTKARLTTTKWVGGSAFALALLLGQKGLDLKDGTVLSYALFPFFTAILIAGFIAVHARGAVAVYGLAYAVVHKLEARQSTLQQSRLPRTRRK